MKKKGKFVQLSRPFCSSYKLFLKGEISRTELQKSSETVNDILFFKEECNKNFDVALGLKQLEFKKIDALIDTILSVMNGCCKDIKKSICRKSLWIFLRNYICFANGKAKTKAKDITLYFSLSMGEAKGNEILNQKILELLDLMLSSREFVKDKEEFTRPIIFKLICLYSALAVSDKDGVIKCNELGKELSTKWSKSTPESVTLSCLKKREKDSKLPVSELSLLEKYSF